MKVLLLNPPSQQQYIREGRCMQTKSSWAALWPPLTLAYCASFLRKNGFEVELWDAVAAGLSLPEVMAKVKKGDFNLAVVASGFPSIEDDLVVVKALKKADATLLVALIGMVPTLLEKEVFQLCPEVDFVVIGEPEWPVLGLAKGLSGQRQLEWVKGLIYRRGSGFRKTSDQVLTKNQPEKLPLPARDLLDNGAYRLPVNNRKFTLLSVGRGCPYHCDFCASSNYYGRKFRQRKPERVVEEIKECINKYDIRDFLFWGETFTLDKRYAMSICRLITEKNLKINWATTTRADTVDEELLGIMKQAGCQMLSIGIESINDRTLKQINKGITRFEIEKAIDLIGKAGIRRMGHFIFGLPGQAEKEAGLMIDFALKSGLEFAQFYCAVPYPKTPLGELARKKGWLDSKATWQDYDMTKSIMDNGQMTAEQIKYYRDLAYRRFYLRPQMAVRALKEADSLLGLFKSLDFLEWIKK